MKLIFLSFLFFISSAMAQDVYTMNAKAITVKESSWYPCCCVELIESEERLCCHCNDYKYESQSNIASQLFLGDQRILTYDRTNACKQMKVTVAKAKYSTKQMVEIDGSIENKCVIRPAANE